MLTYLSKPLKQNQANYFRTSRVSARRIKKTKLIKCFTCFFVCLFALVCFSALVLFWGPTAVHLSFSTSQTLGLFLFKEVGLGSAWEKSPPALLRENKTLGSHEYWKVVLWNESKPSDFWAPRAASTAAAAAPQPAPPAGTCGCRPVA